MPEMQDVVVCADVGSIRKGRFAWASSDRDEPGGIGDLVAHVVGALQRDARVALGFECPTWIPVPEEPVDVGRSRPGEESRSWSGGPGATVLATGLAQIAWVLKRIAHELPTLRVTTNSEMWGPSHPLLLWEAFVSADRKPSGGHAADARAGVEAFKRPTMLEPTPVGLAVNLLALLAAWAGLDIDGAEQRTPFGVYAPPATTQSR